MTPSAAAAASSPSRIRRSIFIGAMLILATLFAALGTWQVQRLFWKLALIERVDARVHAAAVAAPSQQNWAGVSAENDEYRHVVAIGRFRHDAETLVQAVTDLGAGFWVLTPLLQSDGTSVLVNRGFVPANRRDVGTRTQGQLPGVVKIAGLLRMTEPGGAFLRSNDPQHDRWYSRDVAAIVSVKDVKAAAPYFIDADATPNPGGFPVGGLTVIRFRNSHLVYAITWFGLAIMAAATTVFVVHRRLI